MKISTTTKKGIAATALILTALLLLFPPFVSSECPKTNYNINELRSHLRAIIFDFLSDPSSSPYSKQEILDLLVFYKAEKDKSFIDNCDVLASPSLSNEQISAILAKTIAFQKECNDGFDNDADGKIDLGDSGCTDLNDNDETNCGDKICEGGEICSSCNTDCGNCLPSGIGLLSMKNAMQNAIFFKDTGDVVLKGTLTKQNPNPQVTSDDEFIVKDTAGNAVAVINLVTGNMAIKGDLLEKQAALTPSASSNDFVVKDSSGNVISYIDDKGNFYLKGFLVGSVTTAVTPFVLQGVENTAFVSEIAGSMSGFGGKATQYDVCSTDLGSMFSWNSKTYLVFGDTFGCAGYPYSPSNTNWRSNTMAITTDTTPSDGLSIDSMIVGPNNKAKELFPKAAGSITVIPTYGVSVGNMGYLFYMEVGNWGNPGEWTCQYSSIATSTDGGQTWAKQNDIIKWNPGNFNQVAIVKVDSYLYIFGVPCGRFGSVKLMRVNQNDILDKTKYQYFAGLDGSYQPVWASDESSAATIASSPVGELSVRWNEWLGRYIMTYLDESKAAIVIREATNLWGQWSEPIIVTTSQKYPALYGAFMLEGYEENDGETIYFTMSTAPSTKFSNELFYQIYWMKTTLKK